MQFRQALDTLIADLNQKICNGELTERGLARRVGLSQSHIHNVLKGARILTPDVADRILGELNWSLEDLLTADLQRKPPQSATESDTRHDFGRRAASR